MFLTRILIRQTKPIKQIRTLNTSLRFTSKSVNIATKIMAEHSYVGNSLSVILDRLQKYAPLELASSWDNVGLLVDPMTDTKIKNILLTNDLTEDVVQEAIKIKCGLIITYHPNIFQGMKKLTNSSWKERIVIECIKNDIAVFSPHTCWDSVLGGVNDWLASALPIDESQPIVSNAAYPTFGAGRFCTLKKPITIEDALDLIKVHIAIRHLRLALAKNKSKDALISTVAICAGSGNSVLTGIDADLYLTGEMLHHDILDATQNDIHVILTNHSDSERGFLKVFQKKFQNEVMKNEAKVFISTIDCDPLKTV